MSEVTVDVEDRVATVTLNAPERRNSLTLDMVGEIVAAFDDLEKGDVGAVIVTGAPPAFCAGATLGHLGSSGQGDSGRGGGRSDGGGGAGGGGAGLRAIYEGFLRVGRSPLPTLAAVNGAAVGAGMNLALACDVRLAGRSARFDTRFLQLGLHPGGGHTWMLQRAVGPQTAAAAVLFGEVLDGPAAAACGLVWRCLEDADLLSSARETAARAASAPPGLARRVKETLRRVASVTSVDEAVDIEIEAQLWSMSQPDFAERLAALQARISRPKPASP
jgi:enoyl-CoA hydratase